MSVSKELPTATLRMQELPEGTNMSLAQKTAVAREVIQSQIEELAALAAQVQSDGNSDRGFERLKRWKQRTVDLLRKHVHKHEGDHLEKKRKMSFRMGDPIGNLVDEAGMYAGFLEALDQELEEHPADVLEVPIAVDDDEPKIEVPAHPSTNAV